MRLPLFQQVAAVRAPARGKCVQSRLLPTGAAAVCAALFLSLLTGCQRLPARDQAREQESGPRVVTFNRDIAPILYDNCVTCHRPIDGGRPGPRPSGVGELCVAGAPFSLLDYANAHAHAKEIAEATRTRAMPPWLPEPAHSRFVNERRLRDDQIALIERWVAQGAPEGDPADRRAPPAFAEGWQLGTPDLVVRSADAFTIEPGDREAFRHVVVPVPTAETRYVRAVEFRAGNPRVLHHANVAVDRTRASRVLDRADPGPGFAAMPEDLVQNVFGWSPGKVPVFEPPDTAWTLEPGSDLVVQMHMVPSRAPETVQPSIGLFFASTPPTRVPIVVKLESKAIDIPAGDANYVVEDQYVLPADVEAVSVYPHAHALAREMRATATRPDGTEVPLLSIRNWDIRWQDQYRYESPIALPKGTTLRMRFTYDNSGNERPVRWGPLSTDEMGALWLEVVPRHAADAAVLTGDYYRRALAADVANGEMRVRTNPRDAAARTLLASKYVQAGRVADAQGHLEEAVRLQPGNAEAHSNLGTVLQLQGRLPEAMRHLAEAVRLDPDDDRIRFNAANGLHASGRRAEAAAEFRRALALNPENGDAHFNLAMLLGPQGRIDEAIIHLQRAVAVNPQNGEAHRNLAVAFGLQGRLDDAITHARTALRLQPESAVVREHLQRLLAARPRR
jgi:tetratricopeptide (TPR) repeat protein